MTKVAKGLCLMLAVCLALSVTACGTASKEAAEKPAAVEDSKTETAPAEKPDAAKAGDAKLKFWMPASDPAMPKYVAEIKGDMDVEFTAVPYNEYERRLRIAIAGGKAPDIIGIDGPNMASYADGGSIIALDEYWDKADLADFPEGVIKSVQYQGKIYAMPLQETGTVLFYNKKLFAEAGITPPATIDSAWSFEQYYENAKKVTRKDAGGKTLVYGTQPCMDPPSAVHEGMTYNYLMYLTAAGGKAVSDDGKTATGFFDSEATKKVMKLMADLHKEGIAPKQVIPDGFQTGKIASVVTGPWMIGTYDKFKDLEWGTAPMARDKTYGAGLGSWEVSITSQSKNPDLAWKFVSKLGGKDTVGKYCEAINNLPVRKSVTVSFGDKEPYKTVSEGIAKYGTARPALATYPQVSELITQAFNAVAYGEDIDAVVKKYTESINKVLSKN